MELSVFEKNPDKSKLRLWRN